MTISLQGLALARPDGLIASLMQRISEVVGIEFKHNGRDTLMKPHDWTETRSPTGDWTGRIMVELKNPDEVQDVFAKIHGCSMEVNALSYVLEVESSHFCLDATAVQNFRIKDGLPEASRQHQHE